VGPTADLNVRIQNRFPSSNAWYTLYSSLFIFPIPILVTHVCKVAKKTVSFVMSVRLSAVHNNSGPTEQIFMKLYAEGFHLNLSRKFIFYYNWTKISDT